MDKGLRGIADQEGERRIKGYSNISGLSNCISVHTITQMVGLFMRLERLEGGFSLATLTVKDLLDI